MASLGAERSPTMRAFRSLLHPADLGLLVEREYEIEGPVEVLLLRSGFNDTYLVTEPSGDRRVLRVYARDKYWIRSESDLLFELALLEHLAADGRRVAWPYRRRAGELVGRLEAPEGTRSFALFTYADGASSAELDRDAGQMRALGAEIARMHMAMDAFDTDHDRYHLDLDLLIGMPLAAIESRVGPGHVAEYAQLQSVGQRLRERIAALHLPAKAYGPIHADLPGNIHVRADGTFTVFDFDHCGIGWRIYDLAAFYPGSDSPAEERTAWDALLAGYQSIRRLSDEEQHALPAFVGCRVLWNVGDWLRAAPWAGDRWSSTSLCAQTLDELHRGTGLDPTLNPTASQ